MKTFTLLYLALIVNAFSMGSKRPAPLPELPQPLDPPKTEIAKVFKVKFSPAEKYASKKEIEMIEKATVKVNETVASGCFKDFILSTKLKETNGRNNLQVLEHIQGMNDVVPVKIYTKIGSSAIAYRQPPEKTINLNRSYFNESKSPCRWAATMAHESLGHSLGNYGHSYKWNIDREYSVPYKLGGAMEKYGGNAFSKCCKD
jgi:hypothetical protein